MRVLGAAIFAALLIAPRLYLSETGLFAADYSKIVSVEKTEGIEK